MVPSKAKGYIPGFPTEFWLLKINGVWFVISGAVVGADKIHSQIPNNMFPKKLLTFDIHFPVIYFLTVKCIKMIVL